MGAGPNKSGYSGARDLAAFEPGHALIIPYD